ncbi:MAG: hypothetical protein WC508_05335 [Patescibacteria group bacterium]
MIYIFLKLIFAVLLILPRGYLLVYVIDRSKNFSFGYKFFVGWIFGLAAFALDVFSSNVFGGFKLYPWLFWFSAIGQIFGLEFVIFLFERKILLPNFKKIIPFCQTQLQSFKLWPNWEKIILGIIILTAIFWSAIALGQGTTFAGANNSNIIFRQFSIDQSFYTAKDISHYFTASLAKYPPNDSLIKVWLATAAGGLAWPVMVFASLFYYLIFLAIIYFFLAPAISRPARLSAVCFLSNLPIFYFYPSFAQAEILSSIFLFLTIAGLFYFQIGIGNSYFYLAGMALAFAVWTENEALLVFFPLVVLASIIFLRAKRVNYFQLFIFWVFPVITVFPWVSFLVLNRLNIFSWYLKFLNLTDLANLAIELIPLLAFFLCFIKLNSLLKLKHEKV